MPTTTQGFFFSPLAIFNTEKSRKFDGVEEASRAVVKVLQNPIPSSFIDQVIFFGSVLPRFSCKLFFCVIYTRCSFPIIFQTNFLLSQGARKLDIVTCPASYFYPSYFENCQFSLNVRIPTLAQTRPHKLTHQKLVFAFTHNWMLFLRSLVSLVQLGVIRLHLCT